MVIPDPKLPEPAMPWGRQLTQKAIDLEQQVGRLDNDTNNNLQQLNSSVQLLSQNVQILTQQNNDILGRGDIMSQTLPGISFGIGNFGTQTGPIINQVITIDQARTISTLAISQVAIGPYSDWRADIYIDSVKLIAGHSSLVPGTSPSWATGYVMGNNQANAYNVYSNFCSTAAATFQLTAGTHSISYNYWTSGTASNSYSAVNAISLRVSILGYV